MRSIVSASVAAATLCAVFLAAPSARADVVDTSAGVKLMAGGSLWTTPSDRPGNYDAVGFAGNGGGFSWGGGVYFEARFIKLLSLELDIIRDMSVIQRDVTYNQTIKVREKIDITSWRIPVLAKANVPTPFGRLFFLLGPEFVRVSSADPSLEVVEGNGTIPGDPLHAEKNNYTMLTGGLGLTIDLAALEIPIELRASKNLGQEDAWLDRVEVDQANSRFVVDAQTSWDFRVSAGLGYRF
jgi:hypothetical protein